MSSAEKSTSSLRRLDTAALAAASGVRRSWLTADSSERRSSSARAIASALLASSVSSRCLIRPAAWLATARQHPAVAGGQLPACHQHPELVVADLDGGVGGVDVTHGSFADAGDDAVLVVDDTQNADRALRVRLAHPLEQRVQVGAAQHRPGEQREQFGFLRGLRRLPGALGRAVHQRGDGDRDGQQHDDGDGAVGFGDGERVTRVDEEVVEQQPGQQRRQCGRGDAAEQGDHQYADEEQRALPADAEDRGRAARR